MWSNNISIIAQILNNGKVHRLWCLSIPNYKSQLYCMWKSIDINALLLCLRHQKIVYGHMICIQAHLRKRRVAYTCIYVHARLFTMIDGWIVISIILIFDVILVIFMITLLLINKDTWYIVLGKIYDCLIDSISSNQHNCFGDLTSGSYAPLISRWYYTQIHQSRLPGGLPNLLDPPGSHVCLMPCRGVNGGWCGPHWAVTKHTSCNWWH